MTRLLIAVTLSIILIASSVNNVMANPVDPFTGILTDVQFERDGGENGIYTANLSIMRPDDTYTMTRTIALEFTSEMTSSQELESGIVDVYVSALNSGEIAQHNRMYNFWYIDNDSTVKAVMLSINGESGDTSYDTAIELLSGTDCTVIAIVDDANDHLQGTIYTRLGCHMTQGTIDTLPFLLGESLLSVDNWYTTMLPVVTN